MPKVTAIAHLLRLWRTLGCLVKLLFNGPVKNSRLYLVCNSRSGLLLTVALVFVARLLGYRVYLHHHTYGYIDKYNRRMSWINRRMSRDCVHIVHCEQMIDDFCRQYPRRCRFETIFPSVVSLGLQSARERANEPLHLGMLSNLTISKGTATAGAVFHTLLRDRGRNVRLTLAGRASEKIVEEMIEDTLREYPRQVQYLGPVSGASKVDFFKSIDVLLFPTMYREESWGIVINEALAAGVPVITFDRGCTRTVVGDRAGLVVPRNGDFVLSATRQIEQWIDQPSTYREASHAAIAQAEYLHQQGQQQLDEFARCMFTSDGAC
jgi:glycosyltransferase involved in cell wall biosynthesis